MLTVLIGEYSDDDDDDIVSLVLSVTCVCWMVKVRPRYLVCRDAVSECDVPEFCDGISGQVGVHSGWRIACHDNELEMFNNKHIIAKKN